MLCRGKIAACSEICTKYKHDMQCTYNVTLSRVRAAIAAVEKQ